MPSRTATTIAILTSGWASSSRATTTPSRIAGSALPMPSALASRAAVTTTSAGLANSPGCSTMRPTGSQRCAPLISGPTSRVRTSMTSERPSRPQASRRTPIGDSSEAPSSSSAAGTR